MIINKRYFHVFLKANVLLRQSVARITQSLWGLEFYYNIDAALTIYIQKLPNCVLHKMLLSKFLRLKINLIGLLLGTNPVWDKGECVPFESPAVIVKCNF